MKNSSKIEIENLYNLLYKEYKTLKDLEYAIETKNKTEALRILWLLGKEKKATLKSVERLYRQELSKSQ